MTFRNFPIVNTSVYYTSGIIDDDSLSTKEVDKLSREEYRKSMGMLSRLLKRCNNSIEVFGTPYPQLVKVVNIPKGEVRIALQPYMHIGFLQGACFDYKCTVEIVYNNSFNRSGKKIDNYLKGEYLLAVFADKDMTREDANEIAKTIKKTKDSLVRQYERMLEKVCTLKLKFTGFTEIESSLCEERDYFANYEIVS